MQVTNLSSYRSKLLDQISEIEMSSARIKNKLLEAAEKGTNVLQDSFDHSREQSDLSSLLFMNDRQVKKRGQVLSALDRIKKGSFGECCECGEILTAKRLLVNPSASLCVDCQCLKEA